MKKIIVLIALFFAFSISVHAQTTHTVNISFTAPSTDSTHGAATGYKVFRGTVSGGPYTKLSDVTTTSYADTTALEGQTYFYVVSATNSFGESGQSAEAKAVIPVSQPPNKPTTVTCKIDLSSNPPSSSCTIP